MGLYYILYINLYFYLSNITFKKIVKEGTKGGGKRGGRGGEEGKNGERKGGTRIEIEREETRRKAGATAADLSSDPDSNDE